MEPYILLLVAGAAGLGGFIQGFAGFGSTLVALPLLGLALDVRVAVPVGCLMALAMNAALVFRLGRHVNRPALGLLLGASLPGMAVGALLLHGAPAIWLKALLGVSVLSLAACSFRSGRAEASAGRGSAVAAGLVAGCLGVAIGINGPPVVAWTARQGWPRQAFKATLNAYFLLAGCGIVGTQAVEGLLTPQVFGLFAAGFLALLLGVRGGMALCGRFDDAAFRRTVYSLLALTGVGLLWQVGASALAGAG
jgi:uncharacterized membrane protein YfcA